MSTAIKKFPFYMKVTVILFGLILTVYILSGLGGILIPLCFAMLAAVLLNPVFNFICRPGIPRAVSVLVTVLIGMACFAFIFFILWKELAQFGESLPLLKIRMNALIGDTETWISQTFGVTTDKANCNRYKYCTVD